MSSERQSQVQCENHSQEVLSRDVHVVQQRYEGDDAVVDLGFTFSEKPIQDEGAVMEMNSLADDMRRAEVGNLGAEATMANDHADDADIAESIMDATAIATFIDGSDDAPEATTDPSVSDDLEEAYITTTSAREEAQEDDPRVSKDQLGEDCAPHRDPCQTQYSFTASPQKTLRGFTVNSAGAAKQLKRESLATKLSHQARQPQGKSGAAQQEIYTSKQIEHKRPSSQGSEAPVVRVSLRELMEANRPPAMQVPKAAGHTKLASSHSRTPALSSGPSNTSGAPSTKRTATATRKAMAGTMPRQVTCPPRTEGIMADAADCLRLQAGLLDGRPGDLEAVLAWAGSAPSHEHRRGRTGMSSRMAAAKERHVDLDDIFVGYGSA
jgi:hypothetical protein